MDLVRSLGADHVIDYTKEDFIKNGQQYDLILATAGNRSIFDYRRALTPRGTYVVTGGAMAQIFQGLLLGPLLSTGGKKMGGMLVEPNRDLDLMRDLIEAGRVKPVIDRCYPLSQTAEAIRYYGEGHARGKVVITVEEKKGTVKKMNENEIESGDPKALRSLVVVFSYHHGNTRKIADAVAKVLGAEVRIPREVKPEEIEEYDLIGFGSGIYSAKHHAFLLDLVDRLPKVAGKQSIHLLDVRGPCRRCGRGFC